MKYRVYYLDTHENEIYTDTGATSVDTSEGVLTLYQHGKMVAAFAPGHWRRFEIVE